MPKMNARFAMQLACVFILGVLTLGATATYLFGFPAFTWVVFCILATLCVVVVSARGLD